MTIQEIKAILSEARQAGQAYYKAKRKCDEKRARLSCGKAIRFENDGSCHERDSNSVERALCALADDEAEMERCKQALSEPYIRASRLIMLVSEPKERQILNRYYLYAKSWGAIAGEMGVSVRHVHRLHGYALKKISQISQKA